MARRAITANNHRLVYSLSVHPSTWVTHLSRKSCCTSQTRSFAVNGATTAEDLSGQLARFFVEFPPKVSSSTTQTFIADSTTYFFFLGSNDCGQTDTETDELDSVVETLLDGAHSLYTKAGARNFVFLDVAPMDRTPIAIATASEKRMIERTTAWNDALENRVQELATETPRASVFLFSANAVLSAVLDDPEEYDFTSDDVEMEGGAIWEDELHPTSEVHSILADRLLQALLKGR
ncbi:carbohydrate esterase family 16 protein [Peniophora sp. CONT]|nr:carbohydrate esterase family 16 protein [Peniophora sp. CONT]